MGHKNPKENFFYFFPYLQELLLIHQKKISIYCGYIKRQ